MGSDQINVQPVELELEGFYQSLQPHLPFVHRLIRSRLRDRTDAQDVFQETVLRALSKLHQLRSSECTRSWLIRIAINEVYQFQRQKHFEPAFESIDQPVITEEGEASRCEDIADHRETPCEELERRELAAIFRQVLACLPEKYRDVVILCDLKNLSAKEVSVLMNISTADVRSSLHRARFKLRELLRPLTITDPPL